jgi:hypothetical protein
MNNIFIEYLDKFVVVFIDEILIFFQEWDGTWGTFKDGNLNIKGH